MFDRRGLLATGLASGAALATRPAVGRSSASRAEVLELWPMGLPEPAPAGLREQATERKSPAGLRDRAIQGVTNPRLELFRPRRANGAAIIAVPGGGYHHMAWDKEGLDVAAWFARQGVLGLALAYRLPRDGWASGLDAPLADVLRAVRLVRASAAHLGIDPHRIAVVGFSAGGHLVANLAAQFDREVVAPSDEVDRLSARPDLVAPVYPAVMLDALVGSLPASETLTGRPMDAAEADRHSPQRHARADAPPHFLAHAEDDPLVGPEHSLALRAALRARGVAVESHLYARGGHGFGLRADPRTPAASWPDRLMAFGRTTGWIA